MTACDPSDEGDAERDRRAAPTVDALKLAAQQAIIESLEFEPSADEFSYVGHLDDEYPPRRIAKPAVAFAFATAAQEDEAGDLMEIVTRDGRIYRQRPGTGTTYSSTSSRLDVDDEVTDFGSLLDLDEEQQSVFRELITGGVGTRTRVTTRTRQGVMVKVTGSSTNTSASCSASMIAPRVFLTAAHCVTDNNGNPSWGSTDWVMPSAGSVVFGQQLGARFERHPVASPPGHTRRTTHGLVRVGYALRLRVVGDRGHASRRKWVDTLGPRARSVCGVDLCSTIQQNSQPNGVPCAHKSVCRLVCRGRWEVWRLRLH